MKPRTEVAMKNLIEEARKRLPFDMSFTGFCEGRCDECPEKLLEFLDMEMDDWEGRLKRGVVPNLGDVDILARNCKEVYDILREKKLLRRHQ